MIQSINFLLSKSIEPIILANSCPFLLIRIDVGTPRKENFLARVIGESKYVPFGSKGINQIIDSYKPKKITNSSIENDILIKAWL